MSPILLNHYVGELFGLPEKCLSQKTWVRAFAVELARTTGLKIVGRRTRKFDPGVTCLLILSQSHLAIHTWPEHRYMHIDLLACAAMVSVDHALQALISKDAYGQVQVSVKRLPYLGAGAS